jgi:uncharacterized protein (TIGR02186 family)
VRAALALGAALVAASTTVAHGERLTVVVSTPEVQITSNFTGTAVTVLGVIDGATEALLEGGYKVAVAVLGPPETVVARRKDPILGLWVNSASATIIGAPSFYALDTNDRPGVIASAATLTRLGLGFDNIARSFQSPGDKDNAEFHQAYVRLKSEAGLFAEGMGVTFIGDTIFRSTVWLPANISEGNYTVLAYLFAGQELLANAETSLTVSKIGIEETVASFATNQALIYGVFCVTLSLFIGWLGGVIFRRD